MKSLKALVVDDDEQILARMKDRVLDLGHECDAVGSVYLSFERVCSEEASGHCGAQP